MLRITGLEAGIVSHRQWAFRQWFSSPGTRYYHRCAVIQRFAPGPGFYLRVDPDLRELCGLLHQRGLRTTPSCQGHFHDRAYFEERWEELKRDASGITQGGLCVRDSETQREYLFHDRHYRLPWPSFSQFHRESIGHQTVGYLGILLPGCETKLHERLHRLQQPGEVDIESEEWPGSLPRSRLLHVVVGGNDATARAHQWQGITERVRDLLSLQSARPNCTSK